VVATPELVNDDPYGAGWLLRVRLSDPAQVEALLDRQAYVDYLAGLGG
jgi:glycine cleavage system H protein